MYEFVPFNRKELKQFWFEWDKKVQEVCILIWIQQNYVGIPLMHEIFKIIEINGVANRISKKLSSHLTKNFDENIRNLLSSNLKFRSILSKFKSVGCRVLAINYLHEFENVKTYKMIICNWWGKIVELKLHNDLHKKRRSAREAQWVWRLAAILFAPPLPHPLTNDSI